jgi:quercetin dioxygenase-like cupin family protein
MTRLLFVFAICFATCSCHQHSKSIKDRAIVSTDTLKEIKPIESTEIDFVKSSPDKVRVLLENEFVRVLEYSLKPGEMDSVHTHPPKTSYVVSGGLLRVYPENEKPFDAEEVQGNVEWADRRGKHHVKNIGNTTVTILLTEVKAAQKK